MDETPKTGLERRPKTGGRQRGTPNRLSGALRDMILEAAALAGGEGGTVAYLRGQAKENPAAFMALLGKLVPLNIDADTPLVVNLVRFAGD